MTRSFRVSLGCSPLTGKHALDQVRQFRQQLCSLHPKPVGVSLLDVEDVETRRREIVAFYDADDEAAVAWVKQAEAVSAELWLALAERRKEAGRV